MCGSCWRYTGWREVQVSWWWCGDFETWVTFFFDSRCGGCGQSGQPRQWRQETTAQSTWWTQLAHRTPSSNGHNATTHCGHCGHQPCTAPCFEWSQVNAVASQSFHSKERLEDHHTWDYIRGRGVPFHLMIEKWDLHQLRNLVEK
jgi:hypothetical protein